MSKTNTKSKHIVGTRLQVTYRKTNTKSIDFKNRATIERLFAQCFLDLSPKVAVGGFHFDIDYNTNKENTEQTPDKESVLNETAGKSLSECCNIYVNIFIELHSFEGDFSKFCFSLLAILKKHLSEQEQLLTTENYKSNHSASDFVISAFQCVLSYSVQACLRQLIFKNDLYLETPIEAALFYNNPFLFTQRPTENNHSRLKATSRFILSIDANTEQKRRFQKQLKQIQQLKKLGVFTFGDLLKIPNHTFNSRFDKQLFLIKQSITAEELFRNNIHIKDTILSGEVESVSEWIDALSWPIVKVAECVSSKMAVEIHSVDSLLFILKQLVSEILTKLDENNTALSKLRILLYLDAKPYREEIVIPFAQPQTHAQRVIFVIKDFFANYFQHNPVTATIYAVELSAIETHFRTSTQLGYVTDSGTSSFVFEDRWHHKESFEFLVNKLKARLGHQNVYFLIETALAAPERRFQQIENCAFEHYLGKSTDHKNELNYALYLFDRPQKIECLDALRSNLFFIERISDYIAQTYIDYYIYNKYIESNHAKKLYLNLIKTRHLILEETVDNTNSNNLSYLVFKKGCEYYLHGYID